MLKELSLRSFAIAEKTDLVLSPGMTAITGETGAGKSIMVDALELLTGQKADSGWIKNGADQCTISAVFSTEGDPRIARWLDEMGYEQDDEIILKRTIRREGKSRNYLNGLPVKLVQLKDVSKFLLNICGQNDHIELLKPSHQRMMLDRSLEDQGPVIATEKAYNELTAIAFQLREAEKRSAAEKAEYQLLEYQAKELEELDLMDDEFEDLSIEQKTLQNASEIIQSLSHASENLSGSDNSVQSTLTSLIRSVENLSDDHSLTKECLDGLHNAATEIDEASRNLSQRLDLVDINPSRLQEVDERMSTIMGMARKHGVRPEGLIELQHDINARLHAFSDHEDELKHLRFEKDRLEGIYREAASELHALRTKQSKKISSLIEDCLKSLAMEKAKFRIDVTETQSISEAGSDQVDFMFCANVGQELDPLKGNASGGELSRIALALQVVLAQFSQLPVMIFDEVDVGISGKTAAVVGNMLKSMGKHNQVITITHQAPVAKAADQHVKVKKEHKEKSTVTSLIQLTTKERDSEIKSMTGI